MSNPGKNIELVMHMFGQCAGKVRFVLKNMRRHGFLVSSRVINFTTGLLRKAVIRLRNYSKTMAGRFLLAGIGWGLLVYLMSIGALWWTSTSIIHDNLRIRGAQLIEQLDELSVPLYISHDVAQFGAVREFASDLPEIAYVRFYDEKGEIVLGEYQDADLGPLTIHALKPEQIKLLNKAQGAVQDYQYLFDTEKSFARVTAPVWVESMQSDGLLDFSIEADNQKNIKVIGYIDLGLNFSIYQKQLTDGLKIGSAVIAVMFIIALFLGRFLIKRALLPLTNLQKPLKKLADGEHDIMVNVEGDAEIAAICDALNTTIAALKVKEDMLSKLANEDALTGLSNRHMFTLSLSDEVDRVKVDNISSALFFIDLDKFKYVNDTLGHTAGDRLLKQVADLLLEHTRSHDVVSRFGGDEFTVIASNVSYREAGKIAEQLVDSMRDFRFNEDGKSYSLYFSVGVAMIEPDGFTHEEILSQADMACFQAKTNGRNCYHINDASATIKEEIAADVGWAQKIKDALTLNKFTMYFQPIISLKNGQPEFYEVLIRLPDDSGKMILPDAFLPSAERFGLASDIDHWVIRHAIEELSELNNSQNKVSISINLSSSVFEDESIVSIVSNQLAKYQILPESIIFEIREQVALRSMDKASQCIRSLSKLGCRFTLDCFGSGFDSFSYIKDLPVEFLKIDGSFIEKLTTSTVDQSLVLSMVQIANTIGMKTIACHVQDDTTLEELCIIGVDFAQGFHIGKPARLISDKSFPLPKTRSKHSNVKSIK